MIKRYSLLFFVLTLLLTSCQEKRYITTRGQVYGTTYSITYEYECELRYEITEVLDDIDYSLSPFNEKSVITKVNNNEPAKLDNHFLYVYETAMKVSDDTEGAFDITVAPLVNAWGFGFKKGNKPSEIQVDSLKELVGYKKLSIVNNTVIKTNPNIMLDCSAIAKGYGVDAVANMLREKGIQNFLVEIGGEIVTSGVNSKGKPWRVGVIKPVDDPMSTATEKQEVINVQNVAMATSGNYRNFYIAEDGKRYAHTIDPRTGYPIQHNILSATVLAPSCTIADAYSTSFMVVGLDKAKEILKRHPDMMAYIIYRDEKEQNAVWYSPNLAKLIGK
ncbi:MAG: FAD:protein FMN transferase [Bacteroidaceae bacterium]|nr:FAD:protein FMN transferase [Bacteroidaceae bacterium]